MASFFTQPVRADGFYGAGVYWTTVVSHGPSAHTFKAAQLGFAPRPAAGAAWSPPTPPHTGGAHPPAGGGRLPPDPDTTLDQFEASEAEKCWT